MFKVIFGYIVSLLEIRASLKKKKKRLPSVYRNMKGIHNKTNTNGWLTFLL